VAGFPVPSSGNAGGTPSPLSGAAQGAAAGSAFGPYGALIGAGVGFVAAEASQPGADQGDGGGGGGGMIIGPAQTNSQHVTQVALNPTDILFTPSVNVDLGGGTINPANTGGITSSANPSTTPDQSVTNTPQSNPLAGLYAQPGGGGLTLPYGAGGPGVTGPGVSAALSPTTLIMLGGLVLLLVMAGKHKGR
jgi:hypothetical protein